MLVKRQVPRDLATSRCNYNNSYAPQVWVGRGRGETMGTSLDDIYFFGCIYAYVFHLMDKKLQL